MEIVSKSFSLPKRVQRALHIIILARPVPYLSPAKLPGEHTGDTRCKGVPRVTYYSKKAL